MATICCITCQSPLPASKRRRLYSASGISVLPVLQELAGRLFPGAAQNAIVPADDSASEAPKAFLCRPCFTCFEKILRARQYLKKLETSMEIKLKVVGARLGVLAGPSRVDDAISSLPQQSAAISSLPKQSAAISSLPNQPAAISSLPKQSAAISSLPKQPAAISSLPKQPAAISSLPKQPAAISSLPKQPAAISSLPKQPAAISSLPKQPAAISSLPKQPAAISSLPKQPAAILSLPKQPAAISSLPKQSAAISSLPKQPAVISSLPKQPAAISSLPKHPAVISSLPKQPAAISSLPKQPAVISSLPKQSVVISSLPKQPAVISSLPKQSVVISSLPKHPAVISSLLKQSAAISSLPKQSAAILSPPMVSAAILPPPKQSPVILSLPMLSAAISSLSKQSTAISSLPQQSAAILPVPQQSAAILSLPQQSATILSLPQQSAGEPLRLPQGKRSLQAPDSDVVPPAKKPKASDTLTGRAIRQPPALRTVVTVNSKNRVQVKHHLTTRSLFLCKKNQGPVARQLVKNPHTRQIILGALGKNLKNELKAMCTVKFNSVFCNRSPEKLQNFSWDSLLDELQVAAPTLLHLLKSCTTVKRSPSQQRSKTYRSSDTAIVGLCAAILLRHRNVTMNLVQRLISITLFCNHVPKQVYGCLQKLHLCLSHKNTVTYVEQLGREHNIDAKALNRIVSQENVFKKLTPVGDGEPQEPGVSGGSNTQEDGSSSVPQEPRVGDSTDTQELSDDLATCIKQLLAKQASKVETQST